MFMRGPLLCLPSSFLGLATFTLSPPPFSPRNAVKSGFVPKFAGAGGRNGDSSEKAGAIVQFEIHPSLDGKEGRKGFLLFENARGDGLYVAQV